MNGDESYAATAHTQTKQLGGQPGRRQQSFTTLKAIRQLGEESPTTCASELLESLEQTYKRLSQTIRMEDTRLAQSAVLTLAKLLKEGEAPITAPYYTEAMKSLVSYFNKLARQLEDEEAMEWQLEAQSNTEYLMMQALSVISQILWDNRNSSQFVFPFNRSFLQNVFMVSTQLLGDAKHRRQFVRVLSVVLNAIAGSSAVRELQLAPRMRQIVLDLYRLAEDQPTFVRLNRCLRSVIATAPLSIVEVKKFKLLETVGRFATRQNMPEMIARAGLCKFVQSNIVVDPNLLASLSRSAFT